MNGVEPTPEERNWATGCHLAAFAGLVVPFGNVIGPLVVWLIKRNDSAFVDQHGKEAVNFQITLSIALFAVAVVVVPILSVSTRIFPAWGGGFALPLLAVAAIFVYGLVMLVRAAARAGEGRSFEYPLALRFVR